MAALSLSLYDALTGVISNAAHAVRGEAEARFEGPLPPKDPDHGDYASSAALALARAVGRKPRDIAAELATEVEAAFPRVKTEIAGPGFLNITFSDALLLEILAEARDMGEAYGTGSGKDTVILEYGSANPTGPLHVGHARGLVVGSAMANLLRKAGHEVRTEYYINDAGGQVEELARSVLHRAREAAGLPNGEVKPAYPGDYVKEIGAALLASAPHLVLASAPDLSPAGEIARFAIAACMRIIGADLERIGVRYDAFIPESEITEASAEALFADLTAAGMIEIRALPPLPGKPAGAPRPVFKSTAYGDDQDRALLKDDGSRTYFANDCVNHARKAKEADRLITLLGEDHGGYVARIQALVSALPGNAILEVPLVRTVHLVRDGKTVIMSKRAGTFETVEDLLDVVPADVLRMSMLTRSPDGAISFDLGVAEAEGPKNPVWGVNYAHARLSSVLDKAGDVEIGSPSGEMSHGERRVARLIADWPRIVRSCADTLEPHRVALFSRDLADAVNAWWSAGNGDPSLRVLQHGDPDGNARRVLVAEAAKATLASALGVIGVEPAHRMSRPEADLAP